MTDIVSNIGDLASLIGSLTVVGSALIWIYNKFVGAPREKKREREAEERQRNMMELITEKNEPLNQSIQNLNGLLAESQADRKQLNRVAEENTKTIKQHDTRLHDHDDRLIVLETKNGIRKVTYKERDEY